MAWKSATSISKLSVRLEDATSQTNIYGNGRHQIGIVIYVEAVNDSGHLVPVTSEEIIQNTRLINYVKGEELNWKQDIDWNYTDIENKYHTNITGRAKRDIKGTNATFYVQYYNPSSTNVTSKSIAVKATLTTPLAEKKEYSTAEHGDFDSKVTISALSAKNYARDDIKLDSENTASGKKTIQVSYYGSKEEEKIKWEQDNYYFYINDYKHPGFYIKDAEINGYNTNEGDYQVSKNAFYTRRTSKKDGPYRIKFAFNVGYIWKMSNNPQIKNVVLYIKDYPTDDSEAKDNIKTNSNIDDVKITVNQNPRQICLTRMKYTTDPDPTNPTPHYTLQFFINKVNHNWASTNITIYDQYGNIGKFHARPDDSDESSKGDKIEVLNGHA